MAKRNPDLPKPRARVFSKEKIFTQLTELDNDELIRKRILNLEVAFRNRIKAHIASLPAKDSEFKKFNTSPFVLLIHSCKSGYSKISEIESDILPSKQFSSMETSAGRMVEEVVLPVYGWQVVPSSMHSANSALDGMQLQKDSVKLATLKSGPRCLNDEMSENLADAIIGNVVNWARGYSVSQIEFTYGVLYGTRKQSNKKDWHILRNLTEKLPLSQFNDLPTNKWNCSFHLEGVKVDVNIRIGEDWWTYLAGKFGLLEIVVAIIRATIRPIYSARDESEFIISDLEQVCSLDRMPPDYNVSLLQRSQLQWLFLTMYHFCDIIEE